MVDAISHHVSYKNGTWMDERSGVYVGWSVLENSPCNAMPLSNHRGSVALFFTGEDYPDRALISRSRQQNSSPAHDSMAYLVHGYEENPTFPASLNGRFHGLVVDSDREITTIFNDRYGMNRLYFYESKEAVYFAAEAKAILSVRPETRRFNLQSLGEFVACGCVLENRTLFANVHVLPPASAWVARDGSINRRSYFSPREWEEQGRLDPEAFYRELRTVFSQTLSRYFDGQHQIGMSLTGGLDTRMIMAWKKFAPGTLPCYSFGGPYRDCQDVLLARKVARMCRQPHEVIPVEADFLSKFSNYAERAVYLTDGCVEVNRASDLYVNEKARGFAPVRMTGNYGSEVLRWVPAFKPGRPSGGLFQPDFLSYVEAAHQTYATILQGHPVSFAVFKQAPWHHNGLLTLEQTQLVVRTPYLDNDFVRTAFQAPNPALSSNGPANTAICLRLIADGDKNLARLRTDRGLGGRPGLRGAIERGFLEFTFQAEYAYDYGMPQSVAQVDHMLSRLHLERMFLGRHKFAHYRVWYRDALAHYVQDMLLDSRSLSRPYLEKNTAESIVKGHVKGDRNYTSAIHKLLTLELINRLFIDSQPVSHAVSAALAVR
jgi:asparagine synthase (glutamine-hydrolysing)